MVFVYNACPDKPTAHKSKEIHLNKFKYLPKLIYCRYRSIIILLLDVQVQCIASWKDGSNNYFIGKEISQDPEAFRCYEYQAVTGKDSEIRGYKVSRSDRSGACSTVVHHENSPHKLRLTGKF